MANPTATFETSLGSFKVEVFSDTMPITTDNFISLAKSGFYDGLHFTDDGSDQCARHIAEILFNEILKDSMRP